MTDREGTLGHTGLKVSRLGVGAAEIGLRMVDDARAAQVLNTALDEGISFVDTAACYGISEELIGRTIAHRREEYILATKCGHVTGGYEGEPWTPKTIRDSIDRSLVRLKTDHVKAQLPIAAEAVEALHTRFAQVGQDWRQRA